MRFICMGYYNEKKFNSMPAKEKAALVSQCPALDEKLRKTGKLKLGAALTDPKTWKTLIPTGGKPKITDGPYVEAKEMIGGVIIIEAENIDEAVKIASLHPAANIGGEVGWCLEIRPIAFYQES